MRSMEDLVKIEALIRPQRLEAVQEALYDLDIHGMTVTDVRGSGANSGISHTFRGSQYANNLAPRLKVEVVLPAELMDEAVEGIQRAAETGEVGDGKIFVTPVNAAVRIRTGERGKEAIS